MPCLPVPCRLSHVVVLERPESLAATVAESPLQTRAARAGSIDLRREHCQSGRGCGRGRYGAWLRGFEMEATCERTAGISNDEQPLSREQARVTRASGARRGDGGRVGLLLDGFKVVTRSWHLRIAVRIFPESVGDDWPRSRRGMRCRWSDSSGLALVEDASR